MRNNLEWRPHTDFQQLLDLWLPPCVTVANFLRGAFLYPRFVPCAAFFLWLRDEAHKIDQRAFCDGIAYYVLRTDA